MKLNFKQELGQVIFCDRHGIFEINKTHLVTIGCSRRYDTMFIWSKKHETDDCYRHLQTIIDKETGFDPGVDLVNLTKLKRDEGDNETMMFADGRYREDIVIRTLSPNNDDLLSDKKRSELRDTSNSFMKSEKCFLRNAENHKECVYGLLFIEETNELIASFFNSHIEVWSYNRQKRSFELRQNIYNYQMGKLCQIKRNNNRIEFASELTSMIFIYSKKNDANKNNNYFKLLQFIDFNEYLFLKGLMYFETNQLLILGLSGEVDYHHFHSELLIYQSEKKEDNGDWEEKFKLKQKIEMYENEWIWAMTPINIKSNEKDEEEEVESMFVHAGGGLQFWSNSSSASTLSSTTTTTSF